MKTTIALLSILISTSAFAADYRYQEEQYVAPPPSYQHREETVVTGAPPSPPPPQVVYVLPRPRPWNPIGAIMAVPRAALAVPGRILGGDEDEDQD